MGWTVRGSNPGGGGRDFPQPSISALGPTQPPIKWVPAIFPGGKTAGAWLWPSTPSGAEVKEAVQLMPLLPLWASVVRCRVKCINWLFAYMWRGQRPSTGWPGFSPRPVLVGVVMKKWALEQHLQFLCQYHSTNVACTSIRVPTTRHNLTNSECY